MKFKIQSASWRTKIKETGFDVEDLIEVLLINRGVKTKKEMGEFLSPKLDHVTIGNVGMDKRQIKKAVNRIRKAIKNKEKIVVFGDYDVDGICGTAILWETLRLASLAQGKPYDNVFPYIPHRIDEGYGLSIKGINNVILNLFQDLGFSGRHEMPKRVRHDKKKNLIITVDNGIVANKAVEFANKEGIDVIITDHHIPSKKLPDAFAIVHTTKLCGAGVAWALAQEFKVQSSKFKVYDKDNHLELVALATVADLVPLIEANRTLVKFGLEHLKQTKRIGLLELFKEAGIGKSTIGVYQIGHIIAPRINAMGRLDYAMDSLRLLCTNNKERARKLAQTLGNTNRERQELTLTTVNNSKFKIQNSKLQFKNKKLLFIADKSYQQGVIGLVAGKMVEEFYKPSIVVSVGEKYSKASARSVSGFNIIEFIRSSSELLVDAGGHPMAAGFTFETSKLSILQKTLEEKAEKLLDEERLNRILKIDCEIPLNSINENLYDGIQKLSPFGMGNPEPTFVSKDVVIEDMRLVGAEGKHIKFVFSCHPEFISGSRLVEIPKQVRNDKNNKVDGIAFGMGERVNEFRIGDKVDVAYTIDEDTWNGDKRLQLKIKDIQKRR